MATIIITLKIMPSSPEVSLNTVQQKVEELIKSYAGDTEIKASQDPIAFGLKALTMIFVSDESKGATDPLEKQIAALEGVNSVSVTDVRRAIG